MWSTAFSVDLIGGRYRVSKIITAEAKSVVLRSKEVQEKAAAITYEGNAEKWEWTSDHRPDWYRKIHSMNVSSLILEPQFIPPGSKSLLLKSARYKMQSGKLTDTTASVCQSRWVRTLGEASHGIWLRKICAAARNSRGPFCCNKRWQGRSEKYHPNCLPSYLQIIYDSYYQSPRTTETANWISNNFALNQTRARECK